MEYPIFAQDRDKWMYMIKRESDLNSDLEVIDIENNEYIGWDKSGIPLKFYLENGRIKIKSTSGKPQLEILKKAVFEYAKVASPKAPFEYSGMANNVVALFEAVERHINTDGLLGKIKQFLKIKRDA